MYPINQVFLDNGNPLLNSIDDIDLQIQKMENYRQKLKQLKDSQTQYNSVSNKSIWNEIDAEIIPMSDDQKIKLMQDSEYKEIYDELQSMVQIEILNLVKDKIEASDRGKDLLTKQFKIVKKLKSKIINDTNIEMELFKKFKEYSKSHPDASYEEFLKNNI